jgi:antitoxin MazE
VITLRTSIQKWGNSAAVRIPKDLLEEAQFNESDAVEISTASPGIIIIKNTKRKYTDLNEVFEGYNGSYVCREADTGNPVGREVL